MVVLVDGGNHRLLLLWVGCVAAKLPHWLLLCSVVLSVTVILDHSSARRWRCCGPSTIPIMQVKRKNFRYPFCEALTDGSPFRIAFLPGTVRDYSPATKMHEVVYDDGDVRYYDLRTLQWRFKLNYINYVRRSLEN